MRTPTRPLHRPPPGVHHAPREGATRRECQRHRQEPVNDRATNTHHHVCCSSRLLTSANIATCVAAVRRRCQGTTLASRRSTAHQSHATGQCTARSSRVPRPARTCAGLLILRPRGRNSTRCVARVHHGYYCAGMRYVSHANTYPSPGPGHPACLSHATLYTLHPR